MVGKTGHHQVEDLCSFDFLEVTACLFQNAASSDPCSIWSAELGTPACAGVGDGDRGPTVVAPGEGCGGERWQVGGRTEGLETYRAVKLPGSL